MKAFLAVILMCAATLVEAQGYCSGMELNDAKSRWDEVMSWRYKRNADMLCASAKSGYIYLDVIKIPRLKREGNWTKDRNCVEIENIRDKLKATHYYCVR